MKRLSGFIVVRETGAGVPNLIVTAYDSNKSAGSPSEFEQRREQFSIDRLGKRMGSVLTGRDGSFAMTEDLEFEGNDPRPDLSLVVFAPEDVPDDRHPFPAAPEERVLYVSARPVFDAGAEEAFLIRLPQAQLDKFGISADASAKHGVTQGNRFAAIVDTTWDFRDSVRQKLSSRLQHEQRKSNLRKDQAQQAVKHLAAIPRHLRGEGVVNNTLLIKGREDLAANLRQMQATAVADGLKRFAKRRSKIRLVLSASDLKDLGIAEKGRKRTGKVDAEDLAAKIRSLTNGVDLVRRRLPKNPSPDELERKYLSQSAADKRSR
jgi:hypothetical protein